MRTSAKTPIDWLFPRVRKKVLALLLTAPDRRWYLRDIARRTGCAVGTVKRELAGLAAAEIVTSVKDGNRTYYQANTSSPLFSDLASVIRKTAGLADVVRAALYPLAETIRAAFIYGSQAGGTARATSDIDLLVVGELDEMSLHRRISEAEKQLNRQINYTLLNPTEFRKRYKGKGGFLKRVLAGAKIAILGNVDAL